MAADHDATAKALLKWLHIWLDAGEVQPLDIAQERGGRREGRRQINMRETERLIQRRGEEDKGEGNMVERGGSRQIKLSEPIVK